MLDHVPLLQVHAMVDCLEFLVDLIELVHEHVCLALLVNLLALLLRRSVIKPFLLLLEILDLDLLLEE